MSQLQHELFSLQAQVASQVQDFRKQYGQSTIWPQLKIPKDTPSLIDVNDLGRPKEFSGKEVDCPTVVEEDGGILRWSDQGVRDNGLGC